MAECKCKPTECEECPEWIFTFADLVMLMMGFFVILWVLKPAPGKEGSDASNKEWEKLVSEIRGAFGWEPDPDSDDPIDKAAIIEKLKRMKNKGPGQGADTEQPPQGAQGDQRNVTAMRPTKTSNVGGYAIFAAGSDVLDPQAKNILDQIVKLVKGHRQVLYVKGHTSADDFPEGADSQVKLDLSMRRAKAAADYLVNKGVDPEVLRLVGCSTYEPLKQQAYTAGERQFNRRVEVESTSTLVPELQDKPIPAKRVDPQPAAKVDPE